MPDEKSLTLQNMLQPLPRREGSSGTFTVVPDLCSKTGVQYSDVINVKVEQEKIHIEDEDDPIAVSDPLLQDEPEGNTDTLKVVPGLCSKPGLQYSDVIDVKVEQDEICIKDEDYPIVVLDPSIKDEPESIPHEEHGVCVEYHRDTSAGCNREYNEQYDMKAHQHSRSGQLPHMCDVCNKSFHRIYVLKRHQRTHSGERPYICNVCKKAFNEKHVLKRHQIIHSGERPYACDVCQRGFSEKGHLKRHQTIHSGERPYVCNVCNRGFSEKGHLKRHQTTHSGERPYACDVCNKTFSQQSNMKAHVHLHRGLRPYKCGTSIRALSEKGNVKVHQHV